MIRPVDEDPDRLYTITEGRTGTANSGLDLVALIVAECDPTPGMFPEKTEILRLCRRPMSVAEVASHLGLPVGVVRILLEDLLDTGHITARNNPRDPKHEPPDLNVLRRILSGLEKL